ncbi:MAG: hypothetical protein K6D97_04590 [Clostridia bacterium]|nr:hypothetical protein [Clostridia bacterium]
MGIDFYKDVIRILIHEGAKSEDIAFQFDIEKKEIDKYIAELEKQKAREIARVEAESRPRKPKPKIFEPEFTIDRPKVITTRMDKIRDNYARILFKEPAESKCIRDDAYVEDKIAAINVTEKKILKASSNKEKKTLFYKLSSLISDLKGYEVSLAQCDRLDEILVRDSIMDIINFPKRYSLDIVAANKPIKMVDEKRMATVESLLGETYDVGELFAIERELNRVRNKGIVCNELIRKIYAKISKINSSKVLYDAKYKITPETDSIIKKLLDGSATREEYERYLEEEGKRRSESTAVFSRAMDPEGAKKKAESYLFLIIRDRVETYPIIDAEEFIKTLSRCKDVGPYEECMKARKYTDLLKIINLTSSNLSNQGNFSKAKDVIQSYKKVGLLQEHEIPFYQDIKRLISSINIKELGAMVKEKIQNKKSNEDDEVFIELLNKRIEESGTSLYSIPIVNQEQFQRGVSLGEVWYENLKTHRR